LDQKNISADQKDQIYEIKQKMMKLEMDYQAARRHANNMDETNKRMKETLKDYLHQVQVYRVQTEELIKQIDLADAKTREKEDELSLLQAEYEKKL